MPSYQYICEHCEHSFEKIKKMNDRLIPLGEPCPGCGAMNVRQQITAVEWQEKEPKPDSDFRYKLNAIKKLHPGSTVNDY